MSAIASYAHAWETTRRETGIGRADVDHGVTQLTAGAQAVAPFHFSGMTITPTLGILVSRLSGANFTEKGDVPASFQVSGRFRSRTFISPYTNLQLAYPVTSRSGVTWIPEVSVGYRRSAAARGAAVTLIAQDGTVFDGNRVDLSKGSMVAGTALTVHKGRWTGFIRYRGQFADGWTDHGAAIGFRVGF